MISSSFVQLRGIQDPTLMAIAQCALIAIQTVPNTLPHQSDLALTIYNLFDELGDKNTMALIARWSCAIQYVQQSLQDQSRREKKQVSRYSCIITLLC
jgi:hypothetical protein